MISMCFCMQKLELLIGRADVQLQAKEKSLIGINFEGINRTFVSNGSLSHGKGECDERVRGVDRKEALPDH